MRNIYELLCHAAELHIGLLLIVGKTRTLDRFAQTTLDIHLQCIQWMAMRGLTTAPINAMLGKDLHSITC